MGAVIFHACNMIASNNTHDGRRFANFVPDNQFTTPIARGAYPYNKWTVSAIDSPIVSDFVPNNAALATYRQVGAGWEAAFPNSASIGDQTCTRWHQMGGTIGTARLTYNAWLGVGYISEVVPLIAVIHVILNYSSTPRRVWLSAMIRSDWSSSLNACVVATSPYGGPNEDDNGFKNFTPEEAMVLNEEDFYFSDLSSREVEINHNPVIVAKNYSNYIIWGGGSTGQVSSAAGGSFTLRRA